MKTTPVIVCILLALTAGDSAFAQTTTTASPVIEGSKLVVELLKVFSGKKDLEKPGDCKNAFADVCIENQSAGSISVTLFQRASGESREVVVQPAGKECFLRAKVGVWTYDLKQVGIPLSVRKGDLLLEGCNNIIMTIK